MEAGKGFDLLWKETELKAEATEQEPEQKGVVFSPSTRHLAHPDRVCILRLGTISCLVVHRFKSHQAVTCVCAQVCNPVLTFLGV